MHPERGQQLFNRIHHVHCVGSRLALDRENDSPPQSATSVVVPACSFVDLDAIHCGANIIDPHWRAVPIGHDKRAIIRRFVELSVRLYNKLLVCPVQSPGRKIYVPSLDCRLDLINADLSAGQGSGIEFDVHGIFLRPEYADLSDTANHRHALRNQRLRVLIHV